MANYDPLSQIDDDRPGKKKQFDSATSKLSRRTVRQTTASNATRAGQYDRKTITLLPNQIAYIDEIRREEGVGVLAFYRWLIDQGLQNYEAGARPQPADTPIHDLHTGHWSSQPDDDAEF